MPNLSHLPIVSALRAFPLVGEDSLTLEVFVPNTTVDGDTIVPELHATWVGLIARALCEVAGGCTETSGTGYWVNPDDGKLTRESTVVLRSCVTRSALLDGIPRLRSVLMQYGHECEQAVVAFALDGELFGINPPLPY